MRSEFTALSRIKFSKNCLQRNLKFFLGTSQVNICRRPFMGATINCRSFMGKQTHDHPIVVISHTCLPCCGIIPSRKLSYTYTLAYEGIFRSFFFLYCKCNIHIYSISHRPMLSLSPTGIYPSLLGEFHLTERDISCYRRRSVGMSLSEHVRTSEQR